MVDEWWTLPRAAEELDKDRISTRDLARAGCLGPTIEAGRRTLVRADHVRELAKLPHVGPPHPATLVLRIGLAKALSPGEDPAWPERRWLGYRADLGPAERADALRGWWRVENPERWIGGLLVVTLRGLVVAVYEVTGVESAWQQLRRFTVAEPGSGSGADAFRNHWLLTGPGGLTVALDADAYRPADAGRGMR
jgi:hypothetical protein